MNLANISANGQVIVPVKICRLLGLKSSDKILFFQKQNGEVVISNTSTQAIRKAQSAFADATEVMGITSKDDVQELVDEIRHKRIYEMRILIDTNNLFSALLFPRSKPAQALLYVANHH